MAQVCYGGVRMLDGAGPSIHNVDRLDRLAWPMVHAMAERGLQVDLNHFARLEKALVEDMDRITEEVRQMTGYYINLDSGDQLADLLFRKLKLKQARHKLTQSGDRESVEDAVLVAIQHDHPVVPKALEYKELSKLKGTYVSPMPRLARRAAFGKWRMFPNFTTTRVLSGRFATRDPNLLAMPTRTERGRDIRKGFITDEGWVILSVDMSQIEPRIAAHRSKDPDLLRIYRNQEDIYSDFATAAFRLPDQRYREESGKWIYPTVKSMEHRRPSKICVLASLYLVTAMGLQEQMPVICANCSLEATKHTCGKFQPLWTEAKCQDMLNSFYLQYQGLVEMQKRDHVLVRKTGYMVDMWGRMLHVAAVRSVLDWVVNGALREVSNFPMQSGASGCLKLTMGAVWDDITEAGMHDQVHFLLPVHDELIAEAREDVAEEVGECVAARFESCVQLDVPVLAGVAKAESWGALEK